MQVSRFPGAFASAAKIASRCGFEDAGAAGDAGKTKDSARANSRRDGIGKTKRAFKAPLSAQGR